MECFCQVKWREVLKALGAITEMELMKLLVNQNEINVPQILFKGWTTG